MADRKNNSTIGGGRLTKRTLGIAGVLVLVVVLVGAGVGAVLATKRTPSAVSSPAESGKAPQVVLPSLSPTGGASVATTGAASATGTPPGSTASVAERPTRTKTPRPDNSVLDSLKPGQWRLYGARVIEPGKQMKSGGSTDVQGISIECEALSKSGGGYAHAVVQIACSASRSTASNEPWKLFGTWVLSPDDGREDSQHYGQGISGALRGRSSVKPPASAGKVVAGFTPIGAYRPRAEGVIESGRFNGNAMFEGVLTLPSIAVPPPS